jgi:ferredoxin
MDGIVAMQGRGPTAGRPYPAGKILMSADPLALDAVAAAMLGLELEELPIFDAARERGMGEWRLGSIRLLGDHASPPHLEGFDLPKAIAVNKTAGRLFGGMISLLKRRPVIDLGACKDCGLCVESCPVKAIERSTKAIDYGSCIECLCCHELCMHKAVGLKRANRLMALLSP